MPRLPTEVIGDAHTSEFAWGVLEELVEIGNRMAGQEGEAEGARVVADAFGEVGLRDVGISEFDVPGWWRGSSSLSVDGHGGWSADHHVIGLPGTSAGTVEAPLVDVGYGVPEEIGDEVEGAIAIARSDSPEGDRWVHRMEKYAAAAENGAVGFVFRNHVPGNLPPTGEVGYHERPGSIPAVGASKELGARLERYAEEGASAGLSVECRNEPSTSPNTQAVVGDGDEEVLVTAHVDAHDISEGAEDNGVGTALLPEIGRLLARVEDDLDARVRLIAFGAEEMGLWGAYHHAETADLDAVKCQMNIDGAGGSRNPRVRTNGFDAMEEPFRAAAERFDAPLEVNAEVSPHGDSWPFVERGVPAVTVGSSSEESGRGWGHTHADTLDKLDPRDLCALAAIYAEMVLELADADREFPRRDPEEVRDDLADGYVRELEVGGRWHFEDE